MKKIENMRLVLPTPVHPSAGICVGVAILFQGILDGDQHQKVCVCVCVCVSVCLCVTVV